MCGCVIADDTSEDALEREEIVVVLSRQMTFIRVCVDGREAERGLLASGTCIDGAGVDVVEESDSLADLRCVLLSVSEFIETFELLNALVSCLGVGSEERESLDWGRGKERRGSWFAPPGEVEEDELVVVGELVDGAVDVAGLTGIVLSVVGWSLRAKRKSLGDRESGGKGRGGSGKRRRGGND